MMIENNRISSESTSSQDKSERIVYRNEKDNVPMQTEAEEANVHEHAPVEHLAKEVGITQLSKESIKDNWIDLINESVHTSDDIDVGDIEAVSRDFIVVKRGIINIHYYYILVC